MFFLHNRDIYIYSPYLTSKLLILFIVVISVNLTYK